MSDNSPAPWEVLGKHGTAIWSGNEIIAQMHNPRSRHKYARADAVLMAAAPDMLEALEIVKAAFDKSSLGISAYAYQTVVDAISKATQL